MESRLTTRSAGRLEVRPTIVAAVCVMLILTSFFSFFLTHIRAEVAGIDATIIARDLISLLGFVGLAISSARKAPLLVVLWITGVPGALALIAQFLGLFGVWSAPIDPFTSGLRGLGMMFATTSSLYLVPITAATLLTLAHRSARARLMAAACTIGGGCLLSALALVAFFV